MTEKRRIHLICNAHLDPVWLWQWEEGAAEAISTFRVAADFCDKYDGFVFNHNEAVLYQWIEEYEPALFKRIQKLVKQGKWCIMGGWFLQPDCNMPSGESFVRQILLGKNYFREKFGVEPKVAFNADPFGHSRGIVQILAKSGYKGYLFVRPLPHQLQLPDNYFRWIGYDGSEITGFRTGDSYSSPRGTARKKIEDNLKENPGKPVHNILWGIGNHGGGPSKIDLEDITALMAESDEINFIHSSADAFFDEASKHYTDLPKIEFDLNPWAVGCYSSAIRIKQLHRKLENELFMSEKMLLTAAAQKLIDYPQSELHEVQRDLAFLQFHDILPGTMIQPAENDAIRLASHGLETLSRLKTRAFFALSGGQKKAAENDIPVLIYNPHPYKVATTVECEFQLPDINDTGSFTDFEVFHNGKKVPSQIEKEESNLPLDWRKKMVISAELKPNCMNRFDCRPFILPEKPKPKLTADRTGLIKFNNGRMKIFISEKTGLIEKYEVNNIDVLSRNAMSPLAIADTEDPWGMRENKFRKVIGKFKTLNKTESAKFAGVSHLTPTLSAVRVIEDGPVRSIVEALLAYDESKIVIQYLLPKTGTEFEVRLRVFWNQKDTMLKLSVPLCDKTDCKAIGQVAYGSRELANDGTEFFSQKWLALINKEKNIALTCINDGTYSSDYKNGELRLTLLRSPAYSAHPIEKRQIIPADRFTSRMDQGQSFFRFRFNAGKISEMINSVDRNSLIVNEKPFALSFYPNGDGNKPEQGIILSDKVIQVTAAKMSEDGKAAILRLFEPTGNKRKTRVKIPWANIEFATELNKFEIKTYRIDLTKKQVVEVDLLERNIRTK